VTAKFSEPIQPGSITFQLRNAAGALVAATVSYDEATKVATLDPTANLDANSTYTVTLSGAKDLGNNAMATMTWSFTTALLPSYSFWNGAVVPPEPASNDTGAVELGLRFTADADGVVRGLRFYKGAGNNGTHTGQLFAADGTLLASATFANETASGWQRVLFATPVNVTAGATYVVAYHAPVGRYTASMLFSALSSSPRSTWMIAQRA